MADLANETACREAIASAVARFGRLEGVINNAGIGMSSLRGDAEANLPGIEELTAEIWDRFYAINVRGHILVTQAALSHMRQARFGRIINNTTSFRSMLRVNPYGPLKAALEALSAVWAEELKNDGITVNVLIPGGPTDTPFISDDAGWDRAKMLSPEVMGPPDHDAFPNPAAVDSVPPSEPLVDILAKMFEHVFEMLYDEPNGRIGISSPIGTQEAGGKIDADQATGPLAVMHRAPKRVGDGAGQA